MYLLKKCSCWGGHGHMLGKLPFPIQKPLPNYVRVFPEQEYSIFFLLGYLKLQNIPQYSCCEWQSAHHRYLVHGAIQIPIPDLHQQPNKYGQLLLLSAWRNSSVSVKEFLKAELV